MKIIRPGHPKDKSEPWPVGFRFTCRECDCEFQVEKGDRVPTTAERHPGGRFVAHLTCPCCSQSVERARPKTGETI